MQSNTPVNVLEWSASTIISTFFLWKAVNMIISALNLGILARESTRSHLLSEPASIRGTAVFFWHNYVAFIFQLRRVQFELVPHESKRQDLN